MRFRLKAFGLHLSASLTLLTLIFGALYLGWYRWPGWYLTGVLHVVVIVAMVDLALGGGWPIDRTPDPSHMLVDYVRAYAKK